MQRSSNAGGCGTRVAANTNLSVGFRAGDGTTPLRSADEHNLWQWLRLRDELAALDAGQRVDQYRLRLQGAVKHLAVARKPVLKLRSLRHLTRCQQVLEVVLSERILDTPGRLRRAG